MKVWGMMRTTKYQLKTAGNYDLILELVLECLSWLKTILQHLLRPGPDTEIECIMAY